ncbi:hypothetical protein ACS0TW_13015, partial [Klebsiella michiganensis]
RDEYPAQITGTWFSSPAELNRFSYFEKKCVIYLPENLPMTLKRFKKSVPLLAARQEKFVS